MPQGHKHIKKKLNRWEQQAVNRTKKENAMKGEGLFEFRNKNKNASLHLQKPASDGRKIIPPGGTFTGDDYFVQLVKKGEASLVRTIKAVTEPLKENSMNEQKLILDQPDRHTTAGKTEQVQVTTQPVPTAKKINEDQPTEGEALLTDGPIDGVQIILG